MAPVTPNQRHGRHPDVNSTTSMPLQVNLRLLERIPQKLVGELPVVEFAADFHDEVVRFTKPLQYDLEVIRQGPDILVQGTLSIVLECSCARCLSSFETQLEIEDFSAFVPLEGEDAVPKDGDFADLTPLVREDTFLALPTKPLCRPECRGLPVKAPSRDSRLGATPSEVTSTSPWAALEKLKL